jgi:YHS domain-containing protein
MKPLFQFCEPSVKDPVCGMEVSRSTAADKFEYRGKTFYFCASSCREAFEAEPEKYIRRHRQHEVRPTKDQ